MSINEENAKNKGIRPIYPVFSQKSEPLKPDRGYVPSAGLPNAYGYIKLRRWLNGKENCVAMSYESPFARCDSCRNSNAGII